MNYVTLKVKQMTLTQAIMMMKNSLKHLYLTLRNTMTKVTIVLIMITIIIKRLV